MKKIIKAGGTELTFFIIGDKLCGKTALAGRLLFETKALPQEKITEIRKISRELGRETELAFILEFLKDKQEKTTTTIPLSFSDKKRKFCIFDFPGNSDLIKHILIGEDQHFHAIVMIDAGKAVDEQAQRYAPLLKMLEIKNIIIVLNKMDLIDFDSKKFREREQVLIKEFSHYSISPKAIIPVSTKIGLNITKQAPEMAWHKGPSLINALDTIPIKSDKKIKPLRFPVQDIYTINGKSVIAGRIVTGSLQKNEVITLFPQKKKVCVSEILIFNKKNIRKVESDENIGLVINQDIPIKRGDVFINDEKEIKPVNHISACILWFSKVPLDKGSTITLCCATQEISSTVKEIINTINTSTLEKINNNPDKIQCNEIGIIQLISDQPIIIEKASYIPEFGRILFKINGTPCGIGRV
ncbi:MAG: hypothetical protein JXJ04_00470 [Spirochaetales bacterium]|nr:hypothetical protein [Spirochaetales bacterium]